MTRSLTLSLSAALAAALSCANAQGVPARDEAAKSLPPVSSQPAEQMLRAEMQATVGRMIESGAFGTQSPETISMSLDLPAEKVVNVGVLVDPRASADAGVPVLGTVPGGDAQSVGLRAGDVIRSINGQSLVGLGNEPDGSARAVSVLKREIAALSDGKRLSFDVVRGGESLKLSGVVAADFIPAMRVAIGEAALVASNAPMALPRAAAGAVAAQSGGCGRISTFHIAPRSQRLYKARVLSIDGEIPGPADQDTYRVPVGPHVIEVAEIIDSEDLPAARWRQRRDSEQLLEIDVRPDTTYTLAAHLVDPNARDFARGGYWKPVVWKETTEACR